MEGCTMKDFEFSIHLNGVVTAENYEEAVEKINAHLDELGTVDSEKHNLTWPDATWDLEEK